MRLDGSDPHVVSSILETFRLTGTAWSSDGSEIGYSYNYLCCLNHIRIVRVDGSGNRDLLRPLDLNDNETYDIGPTWSLDGTQIAFNGKRARGGPTGAWLINADGTNPMLLAEGAGVMTWLPHENRIAFARDGSIWTMNPDGTDQVRVTAIG